MLTRALTRPSRSPRSRAIASARRSSGIPSSAVSSRAHTRPRTSAACTWAAPSPNASARGPRLAGDPGAFGPVEPADVVGDLGQQPGPLRIVQVADQLVRRADLGHAVALAEMAEQLAAALVDPGRPQRVGLGVDLGQRGPGQAQRAHVVAGGVGRGQRLLQQREVVDAEPVGRVGHLLPELEHPLQEPGRLGVRVAPARLAGGDPRGDERLRVVVRGVPVVGDLGRGAAGRDEVRRGLDRGGVAGVQPGVLAGQQVVVHRLADQRVAELVSAVGVGDDELGGDGRAQRLVELRLREAGDLGEQLVGDAGATGGGDPQHRLGGFGQPVDAGQQKVAQGFRNVGAGVRIAGGGELLDEERVALRALVHQLDGPWARLGAEQVGEDLGRAVAVEPVEVDALDAAGAVELGEERAQRVAAVQLVGAVGADEQGAGGAGGAHQEGDQIAGRAVGPVQVFDDQDERSFGGQLGEQRGDEVEQVAAVGLGAGRGHAQLGKHAGELGLVPVEDRPAVGAQDLAQRRRRTARTAGPPRPARGTARRAHGRRRRSRRAGGTPPAGGSCRRRPRRRRARPWARRCGPA